MSFNYKLFDNAWTFKKVVNPESIMSQISFSCQKNGGQGNLVIDISGIDDDFVHGDIVKVFENSSSNQLVFTGYVDEIAEVDDRGQKMSVSCIGLASYMMNVQFASGGSRSFTLTKKASEMASDIIAYAATIFPFISGGTVEDSVTTVSQSFDSQDCLSAMKTVTELAPDFYFYVDETGAVNFREKPTVRDFSVTYQRDMQTHETQKLGQIYNKLYLTYASGTATYTDAPSIAAYWTREISISDTGLQNLTTANAFAAQYLAKNAYPQENRTLLVNREFAGFWDVRPGNLVNVLNFRKQILAQVEKLEYSRDYVKMTLDKNLNFVELLKT